MNDFKVIPTDGKNTHFDIDVSFEKTQSFKQRAVLLLNTWLGEFVYNTKLGIDYKAILNGEVDLKYLESLFVLSFKQQLSDFDRLENWKIQFNKEISTLYISFVLYSKDGQVADIDSFQI